MILPNELEIDHFLVFLSFSRTQWFALAGGLIVLGAGTIQYMENKAVAKLTSDLSDSVLISESLSYELFMNAAGFCSSSGAYPLSRNEQLVSIACKALARPDVDVSTKAAATWFLTRIYAVAEAETSNPSGERGPPNEVSQASTNLVLQHLDVGKLASTFVSQVQDRRYSDSMSKIMDLAFQVRPPAGGSLEEQEEQADERRRAIQDSLPFLTSELLGNVSRNPRMHSRIVQAGVVEAAVKLMTTVPDVPNSHELLCNLSFSPEGRGALLNAERSQKLLSRLIPTILSQSDSELFHTYNTPVVRKGNQHFPKLHLRTVLANMASSTNDTIKAYLLQHGTISQEIRDELANFSLEKAEGSQRRLIQINAAVAACMTGFLYGGLRGVGRNWYRKMGLSYVNAFLESSIRTAIGAPLLLFSGEVAWRLYSETSDERLFITQSILGTAAALVFVKSIFAVAPFSFLPAANAFARVINPENEAIIRSRRERISEFQQKQQKPATQEAE